MQGHLKARFPLMHARHFKDDVMYVDVMHLPRDAGASLKGEHMALICVLKKRGYVWAGYLDNRGNSVYNNMRRCLLEVGIPRLFVTDPAGELKGYNWKDILNTFHALKAHVETKNQQQDYAELTIQLVKAMCLRLNNIYGFPFIYWTYVMEHAVKIINCTACEILGYKSRHSLLYGETPDISAYIMFMLWQKSALPS